MGRGVIIRSSKISYSFFLFVIFIGALSIPRLSAQGVAQGPPPPASAKKIECKNRLIPQLEDVTEKTGVHFSHYYSSDSRYIVESMGGGVLLLDYDRDGWLDIFFSNSPTVAMVTQGQTTTGSLYHNNHDGTFTDVTEKAGLRGSCFGMGGAVGDFDNDGWPDLYLTCLGGNILYRNNGDGTFSDVTTHAGVQDGRWSTGASFGDYDGDGLLDLFVSNYVDLDLKHLPGFGGANTCRYSGINVQCGPRGLKRSKNSLFHNNGDGTFTEVSKSAGVNDPYGAYGLGVIWADFNNSGRPDVYVANDSSAGYLYRNDGQGKFSEIGLESGAALGEDGHEQAEMGVAVGDYVHNGFPAVFVTDFALDNPPLYRNEGRWNFHDVSYASGVGLSSVPWVKWGDAFVDLDNDGWLDLIVANGHVYPQVDQLDSGARYREPKLLYLNQGNGTFCDATSLAGPALSEPRVSRGLAVADLFNDGNMDVVVEDLVGSPMILRNHGVPRHHWISFELAGTKSNRLAIGARLKIVSGGSIQTAEIHSGGSYLSQNDLRVHFGLGLATKIDSVEVRWPSGAVDNIKDLSADTFYAVLEGKGVVSNELIRPTRQK